MYPFLKRGTICLALMFIAPGSPAPCQQPSPLNFPHKLVKFESEAMPAANLIPALGRATGIKLECADNVARDVLFLHVQDRPLAEVMTKLAEADAAEWQATSTGFIFHRSAALSDRLKKIQLDKDEAGLRKQLQPLLDSGSITLTHKLAAKTVRERIRIGSEELDSDRSDYEKLRRIREDRLCALDSMNPPLRLVGRILRMVGLRTIANMKPGQRIVYATGATPMQRYLSHTALAYAEAFVKEDVIWNAAQKLIYEEEARRRPAVSEDGSGIVNGQDDSTSSYGTQVIVWRESRLRLKNDVPPGIPARVLVSFGCRDVGYYTFKLMVLDAHLQTIIELHSDDLVQIAPAGQSASESPEQPESQHIPLGVRLKILAEASTRTKRYGDAGDHNPPDKSITELLTNPVRNEPLAVFPGDGLSALAKTRSINIAAFLPDHTYRLHGWDKGPFTKGTDLIDDLKRFDRISVELVDGWLVAKPVRPLDEQRIRVDRSALASYLRTTADLKRFSIDAFATYLAAVEEGADDSLIAQPTLILTSGQNRSAGGNEWLLRLYGCLTGAQRERVLSGGQVNYGELNARQRAIAHRAIYGPHMNYGMGGEGRSEELGDLADEPTELAPRGLIPMCGVRANAFVSQLVYVLDPAKEGRERVYTVINPSVPIIGYSGIVPRVPVGGFESLLYEVRSVNSLKIEADIRSGRWFSYTYNEYPLAPKEHPVQLAGLPKEIREPVERHIALLKGLNKR